MALIYDQISRIKMRISKKTDYALRAIFSLVGNYGGNPVSIRELARANRIPKNFLEHIMLDMKSRGWVESVQGKFGGYLLAKPPGQIRLGEIVRHFDGILAPINCVSMSFYEACTQEGVCRFRRVFFDIRNYVTNLMDATTLENAYRGEPLTKEEVMLPFNNFGEGI